MRSHLTAIGTGLGIALLAGGLIALVGPKHIQIDDDGDTTVLNVLSNGESSFFLKDDETELEANWQGEFTISVDGRSLDALEKKLEITSKTTNGEFTAEFEADGDGIASVYRVDGERFPEGANADLGASDLLLTFVRASGFGAAERTSALLADGGTNAVLDEIEQISVDQSASAYIEALAKEKVLSKSDIEHLVRKINSFEGDYAKRRGIVAVLSGRDAPPFATETILAAADGISGHHELRLIIEAASKRRLSNGALASVTKILQKIDGDHELRLAEEALFSGAALSDTQAAKLLRESAVMLEDPHELRLLTAAALERKDLTSALLSAAISTARAIEDAREARLALESVAGALGENSDLWLQTISAAGSLSDENERLRFLEVTAQNMPHTEEIRAAWEAVAQEIESDHERKRVLDLLGVD